MRAVLTQMRIQLSRKGVLFTYLLMFVFVLANFYSNVKEYKGGDALTMINPMRLVFLSDYMEYSYYFVQNIPYLLVIPSAFSYFSDSSGRELVFLQARLGKRKYCITKLISTFLITFLVFDIPMLIEILLNCIAFPMKATGSFVGMLYTEDYNDTVRKYMFSQIWVKSKLLYAIFFTVLLGVMLALLAVLAEVISMLVEFRFKVMIFLPVYIIMTLPDVFRRLLKLKFSIYYFEYFRMFNDKNEMVLMGFIGLIIVSIVLLATIKIRKGEII